MAVKNINLKREMNILWAYYIYNTGEALNQSPKLQERRGTALVKFWMRWEMMDCTLWNTFAHT